jgi:hypothetical protein
MERINAEMIAGISLAFLAILFIYAAMVNPVWAVALLADYVLLALGIALIGHGFWTRRNNNRMSSHHHHEEHSHH